MHLNPVIPKQGAARSFEGWLEMQGGKQVRTGSSHNILISFFKLGATLFTKVMQGCLKLIEGCIESKEAETPAFIIPG